MVIMAGAVFLSIRLALAAIPAIALRYPIKKWAAAGAMAGALGYLLISGAAFATVRSYIMISIMFLAVLLDRPALALRNVALAALGILLVWPESLFDPGFQMSFAAVVALVSVYEWVRGREEEQAAWRPRRVIRAGLLFLGGIVLSTLVASLAVAPFGIYHFHNTQQFAILANLLAIPICNLIVMPAALAALVALPFGLEAAPLWVMGLGIEAMVWCAQAVAALPGAVGRMPAIPTHAFVLMVAGGLWCALWHKRWRLARGCADRRRPGAGADRTAAGCAGRARCGPGRGAGGGRHALGDRRARLQLRAGALARARRRQPRAGGGGQGAGVPLRRARLHGQGQGRAAGDRQFSGGLARRLCGGGDPGAQVCASAGLRPVGRRHRCGDRTPRRRARALRRSGGACGSRR